MNADSSGRLRLLLAEHHRELETACRALLGHTYGEDPRELSLQYRAFERSTLDHLAAEEELILPAYADHDPDDAAAIRREHATIRRLLFQVGIEVELHIVRAGTVKRLIDVLQAHAAREDASVYRWAQDHLPLSTRRQLFVRIGHALRTLARRSSSVAS
ncbi:MAG TPA: hemerythrin domain-containing protein [Kofleriaceae bacterium]